MLVSVIALSDAGNFSAFSYAYAFMLLPHAVVAVSIAYVVAPDLAELWSGGDREGFARRVAYAARMTISLLLPAGVGYALVAHSAVTLALAHGHLSAGSAHLTGSLLVIFALGLPGFSTYLLFMRAFQSKQDTRSMFWLYVVENTLTVVAVVALYPLFGIRGVVAAWIGAYSMTLPIAWLRLRVSAPVVVAMNWWAKVLGATAAMALVVSAASELLPAAHSLALSACRLGIVVAVGAGAFLLTSKVVGLKEVTSFRARPGGVVS
jgi:putative peptidoglycan lipid II flippase